MQVIHILPQCSFFKKKKIKVCDEKCIIKCQSEKIFGGKQQNDIKKCVDNKGNSLPCTLFQNSATDSMILTIVLVKFFPNIYIQTQVGTFC